MVVLLDGSPLADGRADAGIGRYVRELNRGLSGVAGLTVTLAQPWRPPHESLAGRYLSAQPYLRAAAARAHADVVHATDANPVLGFPKARQVVTVHDLVPWDRHRSGPTAAYLRGQAHRIRRAARVIAVSYSVAADVVRVLGVDHTRVRVVPEGIGAEFSARAGAGDVAARKLAGIPDGPYVLWVGSLRAHDPRKALDTLLPAVAGLETTLVLVGAGGAEGNRLSEAAAAHKVRLVLPGRVDDATLAALYRQAAVVAVPSLHEGFGLPVLEAMACGAAVVASAVGNIPDLAAGAADLVPPGDAAALGAALRRVLEDPWHHDDLVRAGPTVAQAYTWARTAELTAEVYREIQ